MPRNFSTLFLALLLSFLFASSADAKTVKIVFVGDSLTEGLGVPRQRAYPALIAEKFKTQGTPVEIVNSGVGGATTAGADRKIRWALKARPDLLILALGANDALRGLPIEEAKKNLEAAILEAKKGGVPLLLIGMKAPPNYGSAYTRKFEKIYPELAERHSLSLVPFLLEEVGGESKLNQTDGIHPNEAGHEKMADTVMKKLEPLVKKVANGVAP